MAGGDGTNGYQKISKLRGAEGNVSARDVNKIISAKPTPRSRQSLELVSLEAPRKQDQDQ